jgi:hypothetical protein
LLLKQKFRLECFKNSDGIYFPNQNANWREAKI